MTSAQDLLDACLAGLDVSDFVNAAGGDVRFVSAAGLEPPGDFHTVWTSFSAGIELQELPWISEPEALMRLALVMLVVDLSCPGQVAALSVLIGHMDAEELSPPILCLPLDSGGSERRQLLEALLELGVDDVLEAQPAGLGLVLAAKAAVDRSLQRVDRVTTQVAERNSAARHLEELKASVKSTLWEWLPKESSSPLPPVDPSISLLHGVHIAGWTLRAQLSSGSIFGALHEAHPPPGMLTSSKAMKMIPKGMITNLNELKRVKRMLRMLEFLRDAGCHPGIAKLEGVFHTLDHIFVRMELNAPETLYQRLGARDRSERQLTSGQLTSIVQQVTDAITHLHSLDICHRDCKPENFSVSERDAASIRLQLMDFDFAMSQTSQKRCRSSCGSFPFMAPEVVRDRDYCGFAADMWSAGVLFLEVLCFRRVVEHVLGFDAQNSVRRAPEATLSLAYAFDNTDLGAKILREHAIEGVAKAELVQACNNLLVTAVRDRWTAPQFQLRTGLLERCTTNVVSPFSSDALVACSSLDVTSSRPSPCK
mmetsp:Transcript_4762/g.8432  ORF Transcript_4762/g.8432 Transcript_4762/m.8432 type:complete len:538 (+) Transcript_4762:51-1664(+)